MPSGAPLVIWTLQRTGGTNLARRLQTLLSLPATQHEPFNAERQHGDLTRLWLSERDPAALRQRMAHVCAVPQLLKHCVELLPWEVSQALLEVSIEAGYQHVFLYRKQALARLLSLHYARGTGVWGPGMAPTGKTLPAQALPVSDLAAHEQLCASLLQRAWEQLLACGQTPWAMAYEDIYGTAQPAAAVQQLMGLLQWLGPTGDEVARQQWTEAVLAHGDQGTRANYAHFAQTDALARALARQEPFVPAPWLRSDGQFAAPGQPVAEGERLSQAGALQAAMEALLADPAEDAMRYQALRRAQALVSPRPLGLDLAGVLLDGRYRRAGPTLFKRLRALRRQLTGMPDQLAAFEARWAEVLGGLTVAPSGYVWPAEPA